MLGICLFIKTSLFIKNVLRLDFESSGSTIGKNVLRLDFESSGSTIGIGVCHL